MAINSSICSISKNSSLFDAINIIINENIEELLVWDESLNRWIWMLTIVDAIRLIMHSLKTIIKEGKVSNCSFIYQISDFFKSIERKEWWNFSPIRPNSLQSIYVLTQRADIFDALNFSEKESLIDNFINKRASV
jgi:hypothetical protein